MQTQNVTEKHTFQAEVKQLLKIVVHSLYSNKEIFLRELISNAADACDKLRFLALTKPELYASQGEMAIRVSYDTESQTLCISDDGIGMTRDEVVSHIGTIAKSGTLEFLSQLTGDQKKDAHLIGQFGVGFYAAFMVADQVTLRTRKAGTDPKCGVQWQSSGDGEYSLTPIEKDTHGTEVILHLKKEESEFLNDYRLRYLIHKYSNHLNLPIRMPKAKTEDHSQSQEWETVNQANAFWTQAKQTIKAEDYQHFYQQTFHDTAKPLSWSHHKIEGTLEYILLFYIPSQAPIDLWQRDQEFGLKLYVQRVFVLDHVDQFLPHYLRFVRGILDTNAIPLNISRELLQEHAVINKLRSALTRHILDALEALAENEKEKYQQCWNEFGNVLKEGPAEDFTNKQRIAKLFRFRSTHSKETPNVSFADYIKRMKPEQKQIYYITADSLNAAKASPHLEIFAQRDIEVLLLSDRIDEWFIAHLPEVEGFTLQSVAKGDLSLEDPEKKEEESKEAQDYSEILMRIKTLLADQIKEARLSKRLTTSPACLVRDQDAMGPQMERLLRSAGQPVTEVKPTLELNPSHTLVKKLLENALDDDALKDWTYLLHDQALLAEGGTLPDPGAFVGRLNKLWLTLI